MNARALGLLLAVSALLSACADPAGQQTAAPPSTAGGSVVSAVPGPVPPEGRTDPTGSAITIPSGVPKTTAPHERTDDFNVVTATGQIRVKGTCVELVTDNLVWVLIGPAATGLSAGQRVKAVGLPDPGFETQCTGSPLRVSAVTPA